VLRRLTSRRTQLVRQRTRTKNEITAIEPRDVPDREFMPPAGFRKAPLAEVIAMSLACNDAARVLGWAGATPFLTLSFLALSVIPSLKITDRGLVDVDRFELVPLQA